MQLESGEVPVTPKARPIFPSILPAHSNLACARQLQRQHLSQRRRMRSCKQSNITSRTQQGQIITVVHHFLFKNLKLMFQKPCPIFQTRGVPAKRRRRKLLQIPCRILRSHSSLWNLCRRPCQLQTRSCNCNKLGPQN